AKKETPPETIEAIPEQSAAQADEIDSAAVEPIANPEPAAEQASAILSTPSTEADVASTADASAPAKKGFFARLRDRLGKTKASLVDKVRAALRLHGKVDAELLDEIEMILIQSDVGVATTQKIIERMRKEGRKQGAVEGDAVLALFKQ